jgi:BirA family biotin operon repressor/biotin-[acetyl-CoA-carboxylase] ligase
MEIKKYKSLKSTSSLAKELEHKPWTIIWAKKQIAGHGQGRNSWFSPEGGLYFSIILPQETIQNLQTLTILTSFAIAQTIKENFKLEPFIKLPNDVFVNQKKVAGVLTENVIGEKVKFSVIGIGLDTNIEKFPKELENIATSLKIETGEKIDNKKILKQIVRKIKNQLKTIN